MKFPITLVLLVFVLTTFLISLSAGETADTDIDDNEGSAIIFRDEPTDVDKTDTDIDIRIVGRRKGRKKKGRGRKIASQIGGIVRDVFVETASNAIYDAITGQKIGKDGNPDKGEDGNPVEGEDES